MTFVFSGGGLTGAEGRLFSCVGSGVSLGVCSRTGDIVERKEIGRDGVETKVGAGDEQ